jgi:predicted ABC-type ATPase
MSLSEAFVSEDSVVSEGLRDSHTLRAVFLAGAGGAGKSLVSTALFGGAGLKIINADKHLERYMKFAGIPPAEVGKEYGLFTKARDAMKMELRHYAQRRLGLIIDGTAWAYDRVAKPARKLRALGYDIFMVFVTTSLEKALERNRVRKEAGGRFVPDSFVEDAWRGAHRNMEKYAKLFGPKNMRIVDNNVDVSVDDWVAVIKPQLHNLGQRILKRPLKNPIGKAWLKKQQNPATRTFDKPGKNEWPKPKVPPPFNAKKYKAKKTGKKHGTTEAIIEAMDRSVVEGPLFLRPGQSNFIVESVQPATEYYIHARPDLSILFEREQDGVYVPTEQFRFRGSRFISERADVMFPIALDEKHWRDNPKDFRNRYKITPEKSHSSHEVASIGKGAKTGKWYGWSHRAFSGFGVGDKFFPKLTYHGDWEMGKQDDWEKEQRAKAGKIKTDAEARQSAVNFADWVS